ncbi:uncharacterized protein BDV14DRAFT_200476 [Aspergillus stella-maris]|uniref:uncharacterized protein n=1 Tax=Aspergillus stella-maris TaxID=1810926 RepID=UPI003CCD46AD
MRLSLFLVPFAAHHVFADSEAGKDALEALRNMEGLGNIKDFASIASILSSLVDGDGGKKEDGAQPAREGSSGLEDLESISDEDVPTSGEAPVSLLKGQDTLSQIQNIAGIASSLFALVERQGAGSGDSTRTGQSRGEGGQDGYGESNDASGGPLDLLKSIGALQRVMDLASGIGKLANEELEGTEDILGERAHDQPQAPLVPPTPSSKIARPSSSITSKQQTAKRQSTAKTSSFPPSSTPKPAPQPDFFARLDAIQRFSKLAQKITALSNENPSASYSEKLKVIFSDPEITATLSYIFENAHKLLTPEVLTLLKTFLRTSPVIPDEYRSLSITVADSLGAIFSPEFARHFASAKKTLDDVGIDLLPALETLWDIGKWTMNTFDADYIQSMNRQVALWRRALTSDEMGVFVEWISDPVTIRSLTERVSGVKDALTAERIHALNELLERRRMLKMENEEYQAFGSVLGERVRWYLSTEQGLAQLQLLLDMLNELHTSHALVYLPHVLQSRVAALTPDLAGPVNHLSVHLTALSLTDVIPQVTTTLQDIINLMIPLLDPFTRADTALSWLFWTDLNLVVNRVYATPLTMFRESHSILVFIDSLLQADNGQKFRQLLRDPVQTREYIAPSLLVPVNLGGAQNVSAVVMSGLEFEMGVSDLGMTPVVSGTSGHVSWVFDTIYARLEPGRVEETRKSIKVMSETISLLVQIMEIFQNSSVSVL